MKTQYSADPDLRWLRRQEKFALLRGFTTTWGRGKIEVPSGFYTDLASIPQIVRSIIPQVGRHIQPAIVHDWCYKGNTKYTRKQADRMFLDGMEFCGVPRWKRAVMYRAVRIASRHFWKGV